ncbi:MAG: nucleotidyltransferase domain-containing protein [Bacteroidetes bacterium]|nr:nucleotidyltransferase domain-containing protein [Bacteroidota bacterium]
MLTKETAIDTVKAFVIACNKRNITFNKVILFGSLVNGNSHQNSDIDVALISDAFTGNPFADWHLLSPININFTDIEPHPFSPHYFEKGDPFIDEIKRTGVIINA